MIKLQEKSKQMVVFNITWSNLHSFIYFWKYEAKVGGRGNSQPNASQQGFGGGGGGISGGGPRGSGGGGGGGGGVLGRGYLGKGGLRRSNIFPFSSDSFLHFILLALFLLFFCRP